MHSNPYQHTSTINKKITTYNSSFKLTTAGKNYLEAVKWDNVWTVWKISYWTKNLPNRKLWGYLSCCTEMYACGLLQWCPVRARHSLNLYHYHSRNVRPRSECLPWILFSVPLLWRNQQRLWIVNDSLKKGNWMMSAHLILYLSTPD